jgi:predicted glutamine amidotransferase
MCRLLGYCARDGATSLGELLGEGGLSDFTELSGHHRDGWGMAWYEGRQPPVEKSPLRAADDRRYGRLAHRRLSDLGLVHLRRASPGLPIGQSNSHPFRLAAFTMAHNGSIHPQSRLGELLPPPWAKRLAGSTDSERYFLYVMSRLEGCGGDMLTALADTAADLDQLFFVSSLNAVFLAPDALYAVCWYDPGSIPGGAVAQQGYQGPPERYFDLGYRETPGSVIVASSGWRQPGWTCLANRHVLVVDRATLVVTTYSLEPVVQPCQPDARPPPPTPGVPAGQKRMRPYCDALMWGLAQ